MVNGIFNSLALRSLQPGTFSPITAFTTDSVRRTASVSFFEVVKVVHTSGHVKMVVARMIVIIDYLSARCSNIIKIYYWTRSCISLYASTIYPKFIIYIKRRYIRGGEYFFPIGSSVQNKIFHCVVVTYFSMTYFV